MYQASYKPLKILMYLGSSERQIVLLNWIVDFLTIHTGNNRLIENQPTQTSFCWEAGQETMNKKVDMTEADFKVE